MTENEARKIMERATDSGAPLPNIVEYSEALRKTREILGSDYTEEQLQNWILVGKYPFLMPKYWDREEMRYKIDEDYHYTYTELDAMPKGWRNAFGEMMCEEIYNALVDCGSLDDYMITQIKEKFGQLRWYGSPSYKEVERIVDKYSVLSENICMFCGKPDVPMTGDYWVYPFCKNCYCTPNDYVKGDLTEEELKQFYDRREKDWECWYAENNKMNDSYTIKSWSKETGEKTTRYDISSTANKIRAKWRAEHGE